MTRRLAVLTLVTLLACTAALAKPNFSGQWKLNVSKSDLGPMPPPEKWDRRITHEDPNLQLVTTQVGQQGEFTTDLKYTTDGKECTNTIVGSEVKGTARWDGEKLLIDSKRSFQGNELTFKESWTLAEDGKTITINTAISGARGEFNLKFVLEKQ